MKKLFILIAVAIFSISASAMSDSRMRQNARFLTDRMAHELDLSIEQYEDCYEINYDFIHDINRIMDDVIYGYEDAFYTYYQILDNRNDDMRYVLTARQYNYFVNADYFFRPVYSTGRTWNLRIYKMYSNTKFYYYDAPKHYSIYRGARRRTSITAASHYKGSYNHVLASIAQPIRNSSTYENKRRSDFGHNIVKRNEQKANNYNNRNSNNRTNDKRYNEQNANYNRNSININNNNKNNSKATKPETRERKDQNGNNNSGIGNNSRVESIGNGVGVRAHHR